MHVIGHGQANTPAAQDEITPMLIFQHMVEHNFNHINELIELSGALGEEAKQKMAPAIETMRNSNEQLAAILTELKEK